jgi:PiT family inorganic phosphate transporter
MLELVILTVALALVFDFYNGMNDAANSIATVVSTRILTPRQAVAWAAFWNFVAAFVFGTAVAKSIHSVLNVGSISQVLVLAVLVGAILWTHACTKWGMPISVSHALIAGVIGAGLVHARFDLGVLNMGKISEIAIFIFLAPVIGLMGGMILMVTVYRLFHRTTPGRVDRVFRTGQLMSAAAFSLGHGANDAQKTMGIIAMALAACASTRDMVIGADGDVHFPYWVILSAHAAIAIGTLVGGANVIRTMGSRLTKLKPVQGFCAEGAAAGLLFGTAYAGIPVSTTHTVTGSIMGVGAVKRWKAVRWGVATRIVWAWVFTIPSTAAVSGLVYWLADLLGLVGWAEGVR